MLEHLLEDAKIKDDKKGKWQSFEASVHFQFFGPEPDGDCVLDATGYGKDEKEAMANLRCSLNTILLRS